VREARAAACLAGTSRQPPRDLATTQLWQTVGVHTMAREDSPVLTTPSHDDPVLGEVVRRLVEVYHPERIYMFGSVARGEAGPDSDYDLMILLPETAPRELRSEDIGYRVLRGIHAAADLLVLTRRDFDRQLHLKASLPATVVREGRTLYNAAA